MKIENNLITGDVISKDGTKIGYSKFGQGPAVVICHGSYTIQQDWYDFAQELSATKTVYVYDRRGRGKSPDIVEYSYDGEIDDLAAMVALAGPGTSLLGHSYGAGLVLAYLIRDGFTGKTVMYEPMNSIFQQVSAGYLDELNELVAKGDLDTATYLAQTKVVGLPEEGVAIFRENPFWPVFSERTPIALREFESLDNLKPIAQDAEKIKAQTWLLLGDQTWKQIRVASAGVVSIVKGLTLIPVRGQHHMAHTQNPKLLKDLVLHCLAE
jgi:pimeloyl-ACP methyl ester carboxylesterase